MKDLYVVIRDRWDGNDAAGLMWQETKIFHKTTTIEEVMRWATGRREAYMSQQRITITIPDNQKGIFTTTHDRQDSEPA